MLKQPPLNKTGSHPPTHLPQNPDKNIPSLIPPVSKPKSPLKRQTGRIVTHATSANSKNMHIPRCDKDISMLMLSHFSLKGKAAEWLDRIPSAQITTWDQLVSQFLDHFFPENNQLPVVISSALSTVEKARLLEVLRNHKGAIAWSIADIKGIDLSFCTYKILMEDEFKPSVQPQRRVNPNITSSKKGFLKLLDAGFNQPHSDSPLGESCPGCPKERDESIENEKHEHYPENGRPLGGANCIRLIEIE
ncbi:putative reverse transcriptase domain-containing protein [Tanacetum coccineum]|uniref:Reverse transcriptase domain-containing protein n=1 Tax=Tanacetum coccineum TaxID=301880 RepID=A0ABQ5EWQ8_9ASTR